MDKIIFFDLDETLLTTSYRQFSVVKDFLASKGLVHSTYKEYKRLRKDQNISNTEYFKLYSPLEEYDLLFKKYFAEGIESEYYLDFDKLIVDKSNLEALVSRGFQLYLLSLRGNEQLSQNQLKKLGLSNYFKSAYFIKHNPINPKIHFLKKWKEDHKEVCLYIGDSYSDYEAAIENGIKFFKVETGIYKYENVRSESFLNINKLMKNILKNGV